MATATAKKQKMVTAVFRDRAHANAACDWLMTNGYSTEEINLLMAESTKTKYYVGKQEGPIKAKTHAAEGVAAGGAIGTAIGATVGAIAAIGISLMIPGLGIVVAGPIAGALAGGGAGAVAGGTIGGLVGLGIPESNALAYEEALREGGIALGVNPHSEKDRTRIKDEFAKLKGENIINET